MEKLRRKLRELEKKLQPSQFGTIVVYSREELEELARKNELVRMGLMPVGIAERIEKPKHSGMGEDALSHASDSDEVTPNTELEP